MVVCVVLMCVCLFYVCDCCLLFVVCVCVCLLLPGIVLCLLGFECFFVVCCFFVRGVL